MQNNCVAGNGKELSATLVFALRSALAKCLGPSVSSTDLEDCADLAATMGERAIANALRQMSQLLRGFAPERTDWQNSRGSVIETAIAELRQLMIIEQRGNQLHDILGPGIHEKDYQQRSADCTLLSLPGQMVSAIRSGDLICIGSVIRASKMIIFSKGDLTDKGFSDSLEHAAEIVIACLIRLFIDSNAAIFDSPFGSPALLSAAARLPHGALGPYLSGIERLLRKPSDLFGIIALAAKGEESCQIDCWLVIMFEKLGWQNRCAIISLLADTGRVGVIHNIWENNKQRSYHSIDVLKSIRDSAIDLGVLALARDVQCLIVKLKPFDVQEKIVLAEIYGTSGEAQQALSTLEAAMLIDAQEKALNLRLDALRSGKFERYHVNWGYHTTPREAALRAQYRPLA